MKDPQPIPEKPSGEGWPQEQPEKKKSGVTPILLSILLAVVILGVGGGSFVYNNVIKPRQIDKAAPSSLLYLRSVILRSSKSSGADFNKIGSIPYGTELITYDYEWSEVKVNSVNAEGKKLKAISPPLSFWRKAISHLRFWKWASENYRQV